MVRKNLTNAIKLPSSRKVFCHGDGTFEKNTLIALLEEGWKRKLKSKDKIITTEDYLPDSFYEKGGSCPTENDLRFKKEIVTYGELNKIYERMFDEKYSPEAEEERNNFEMDVIERQGQRREAWGWYAHTMAVERAIEREQKREEQLRGKDSSEKERLKKEWEKEDKNYNRTLYIA